ncbi:chromate efflux transporter [Desulfovibrio oxyclinae]|uniref:chromate efflux transporter n=1 Tax=Desulfovibrio oxyclinae TaxID=63560 RepID=UPI000475B6C2|nr:chromate efflux transporter [Desulfovibrio oxyclinae]
MNKPSLLALLGVFLKLGTTAFGGPAMIPYIKKAVVERHGWLDEKDFSLGMGAAQLVPGATAMQVAAWAGLRIRGTAGAFVAYLGFSLPAFLLMLGLSVLYFKGADLPRIQAAFAGLQVVVVALVLSAAFDFALQYCDSIRARLLALGAGIWLAFKGNPVIALVVVCLLAVPLFRELPALRPDAPPGGRRGGFLVPSCLVLIAVACWLVLRSYLPELGGLAALMARIDLFAFGGGYVSVPLMLHEVVEVRGWLTEAGFMDGIALGQLTPGPIVMTATFVGYKVAGLVGAAVATVAVFTPSFIILRFIAPVSRLLVASPVAARMLKGSLIGLVGLMAAVAGRFVLSTDWTAVSVAIAVGAFIALRMRVDVLRVVVCGAAAATFLL